MQKESTKVFKFNVNEYKGGIASKFLENTEHRSNDVYIAYRLPNNDSDDEESHVGCYPFGTRCKEVEEELFRLGCKKGEDVIIHRMW